MHKARGCWLCFLAQRSLPIIMSANGGWGGRGQCSYPNPAALCFSNAMGCAAPYLSSPLGASAGAKTTPMAPKTRAAQRTLQGGPRRGCHSLQHPEMKIPRRLVQEPKVQESATTSSRKAVVQTSKMRRERDMDHGSCAGAGSAPAAMFDGVFGNDLGTG